jgi:hypothetical protein
MESLLSHRDERRGSGKAKLQKMLIECRTANCIIRIFSEWIDYCQQWNIFAVIKNRQKENG